MVSCVSELFPHCIFSHRVQTFLALLLLDLPLQVTLSQCTTLGSCQFATKVQRLVLGALVELSKVFLLCLMDDSQHSGNTLADNTNFAELGSMSPCYFGNPELGQLLLQLFELVFKLLLLLASKLVCLDLSL